MKKVVITFVSLIVLLILFGNSFYVVREDEVAIVKTFGEVIATVVDSKDADIVRQNLEINGLSDVKIIQEKGLHMKVPFIQSVETFTSKVLTYTSVQESINTKDNKYIDIQMYAQYRVMDPVRFYMVVKNIQNSNRKIDEMVYLPVIQSANSLEFDQFFDETTLENMIEAEQELLNESLVRDFGIYVSDVGINRKSFPYENVQSIENKMTLQIEKESEKLMAEGDSAYLKAKAATDRKKSEIISAAMETAATTKAEADAEAMRIYQEALAKDLEFYRFITRMEIYKQMTDTTVFIDSDNAIFDYINGYGN